MFQDALTIIVYTSLGITCVALIASVMYQVYLRLTLHCWNDEE